MGKILSIVVPAYNVENYLERCLSSMVIENGMDDIEVLVIDDGSKDGTASIARKYCEKYPAAYYLYQKENGGHGSGINYGIRYASGKYFKIVDGDDWLDTAELPQFLEVLKKTDADVVAADYRCIQDETDIVLAEKYATPNQNQYGKICSMEKGEIEEVIKMHSFTIRTEILKNHIPAIDEHCFYVDSEYITYPVPFVETVYFYQKFLYCYRLGRDGQSMDIVSMQKNRAQHLRVLESLLHFYEQLDGQVKEANRRYIEKCIAQIVENQFQIYISMGLEKGIFGELKKFDRELLEKYPRVYHAVSKKSIYLLRRTNYLMLPFGAVLYRIVRRNRWKKH